MTATERRAAMACLRKKLPMPVLGARDRWICWLCGGRVDHTKAGLTNYADLGPTRDHIIPLEQGGPNKKWNVALAHRVCNNERHIRFPETLVPAEVF